MKTVQNFQGSIILLQETVWVVAFQKRGITKFQIKIRNSKKSWKLKLQRTWRKSSIKRMIWMLIWTQLLNKNQWKRDWSKMHREFLLINRLKQSISLTLRISRPKVRGKQEPRLFMKLPRNQSSQINNPKMARYMTFSKREPCRNILGRTLF